MQTMTKRLSPNRNTGRNGHTPDFIVLHTTGGSFTSAINTIMNPANAVSYHFVISRTGEIVQAVDIENTAWASGTTTDGANRDPMHSSHSVIRQRRATNANLYTINIGFGDMPKGNPSEEQLASATDLILFLKREVRKMYNFDLNLTRTNIIGHADIVPRHKPNCPGRDFPFDELIRRIAGQGSSTAPGKDVAPWAVSAWKWAVGNGITDGTRPLEPITRQEAVVMLHRFANC